MDEEVEVYLSARPFVSGRVATVSDRFTAWAKRVFAEDAPVNRIRRRIAIRGRYESWVIRYDARLAATAAYIAVKTASGAQRVAEVIEVGRRRWMELVTEGELLEGTLP